MHPAKPPETKTSLDNFLDPTADCPLCHSGLFAVQLCKPTRDNIVSGQISSSTVDCPLSNSRPSAILFYETNRDNIVSGQILTWSADCPAPLGGPSATPIFDTAHRAAASAAPAAASAAPAAAVAHRRRRHSTEGEQRLGSTSNSPQTRSRSRLERRTTGEADRQWSKLQVGSNGDPRWLRLFQPKRSGARGRRRWRRG